MDRKRKKNNNVSGKKNGVVMLKVLLSLFVPPAGATSGLGFAAEIDYQIF